MNRGTRDIRIGIKIVLSVSNFLEWGKRMTFGNVPIRRQNPKQDRPI